LCVWCVSHFRVKTPETVHFISLQEGVGGMTSCHHGHSLQQNNLKQAIEVLKTNREIGVVEIDFVQVGDDFVSSHDYTQEGIQNGSTLLEWIQEGVVNRGKILWVDIKSHVDFTAYFCCCDMRFKFDCRALFRALGQIYKRLKQRLQDNVWLSCQDREIRDAFIRENNRLKACNRWTIATDIPFVYSYAVNACRYVFPTSMYNWLQDRAFADLLNYDFDATRIYLDRPVVVCIDQSFFPSVERLIKFIEDSTIPLGSKVILYTFSKEQPPIVVPGYEIIMQYDYVPQIRKKHRQPFIQPNKSKSF